MRYRIVAIVLSVILSALILPVSGADPIVPETGSGFPAVGETFMFGHYEQDGNWANGREPIAWRVLAVEGDAALLISQFILDAKAYNDKSMDITWENCTLRRWLNDSFLINAFSEAEQRAILTSPVTNGDNPEFAIGGGADTKDRVFLLSIAEAENYFSSDNDRKVKNTAYAQAQGSGGMDDITNWWLRSPGQQADHAVSVSSGFIHVSGYFVFTGNNGVRPALRLDLKADLSALALSASLSIPALPASDADPQLPETSSALPTLPVSGSNSLAQLKASISSDVVAQSVPEDFVYTLEYDKATITKYNGTQENLVIPKLLGGCPVVGIGERAFARCMTLRSISLPPSVARIGSSAFFNCANLENVSLPEGLTELPDSVFAMCERLSGIAIPDSVTSIGPWAFANCSGLASVALPSHLTTIGSEAFLQCAGLKSISMPDGVTVIGDGAFSSCGSLERIVLPRQLVSIGKRSFAYCGSLAEVVFPKGMQEIGEGAFTSCDNLISVTLPEGITNIPADAFSWCRSLETLSIPSSVRSIDLSAISVCRSLSALEVSGANAHYTTQDGILYDKGMKTLIKCPQAKSGIVTIPEGVETILPLAFDFCEHMTAIQMPDSLREIGAGAFRLCRRLSGITIPQNVSGLPGGVFESCSGLEDIKVAEGSSFFTSVDGVLFSRDLKVLIAYPSMIPEPTYDIPEGVAEIASYAFDFNPFLKVLNVPFSVVRIGEHAFQSYGLGMSIRSIRGSYTHQYLVDQGYLITP